MHLCMANQRTLAICVQPFDDHFRCVSRKQGWNMVESRLALVTGATGGVGGEVATALLRHGWTIRAMARDPARAAQSGPKGVNWVAGDAMRPADITAAARGAAVVFHGVNPPGYQNWRGLAIPMLRNAIDAAQAAGARLIYPSNVYVYSTLPILTGLSWSRPSVTARSRRPR